MADIFGAIGSFAGLANSNYSHQLGRDDLKFSNDLALSNWRLENDYNSPTAQMSRLKAAGLNPNLVAGSLSSSSSAVGSLGSVSSDAPSPLPIGEGLGEYAMQQKQLQIQKSVADSEIKVNEATADEIKARTPGHKQDQEIKGSEEQRAKDRHEHEKVMNQFDEVLKGLEVDDANWRREHREEDRAFEIQKRARELDITETQYRLAEVELNLAIDSAAERLRSIRLENRGRELTNDQISTENKKLNAEAQLLLDDFAQILPLQKCIGRYDDGTFYVIEGKEAELYLRLRLMGRNNERGRYAIKLLRLLKVLK